LTSSAAAAEVSFVDKTAAAGLPTERIATWGQLWVDHDRDGWPDLFLNRHEQAPKFFVNAGGSYDQVFYNFTAPLGYDPIDGDMRIDRHGCAWGEATGDGRPDLYCGVGANSGTSVGPNQLLKLTSDGLRDVAKRYGVGDIYGRARTVNWLDHDSDGDLDLYVGNFYRSGAPSVFFINKRGSFVRSSRGLSEHIYARSSSWADWDRDGDPDLLVTQWARDTIAYKKVGPRFVRVALPHVTGQVWQSASWGDFNNDGATDLHMVSETRSVILRNAGGTFQIADSRPLTEGRSSVWFDAENDGDLDLFVVQGARGMHPDPNAVNHPDFVLLREQGHFVKVTGPNTRGPERGNGDTVTAADSDRDGRVDLFVSNGFYDYYNWPGSGMLLRNRSPQNSFIALDLNGGRWNPLGFGARITVTTARGVIRRQLNDGIAFRGQSEMDHQVIGIGRATRPTVRVRWTDGSMDCLQVSAGETAAVQKGASPCGS
jgi:FG-GAP-like repeat/ASPIC and UnbV